MDFDVLFQQLIRFFFKTKRTCLEDIMCHLESLYRNRQYFVVGAKPYKLRGYKRVKEQLQAMRYLGILSEQGVQNGKQVLELNEAQKIDSDDLDFALRLNRQKRLKDKIQHVHELYNAEYINFSQEGLRCSESTA